MGRIPGLRGWGLVGNLWVADVSRIYCRPTSRKMWAIGCKMDGKSVENEGSWSGECGGERGGGNLDSAVAAIHYITIRIEKVTLNVEMLYIHRSFVGGLMRKEMILRAKRQRFLSKGISAPSGCLIEN